MDKGLGDKFGSRLMLGVCELEFMVKLGLSLGAGADVRWTNVLQVCGRRCVVPLPYHARSDGGQSRIASSPAHLSLPELT